MLKQNEILNIKKKVLFNYFLYDIYEAGIVLFGWEIKALRGYNGKILSSYCKIINNECWVFNFSIFSSNICYKSFENREKKILLKKKEITYLNSYLKLKGYSLLPVKLYWKQNLLKLEIALCYGKKKYDKKKNIIENILKKKLI